MDEELKICIKWGVFLVPVVFVFLFCLSAAIKTYKVWGESMRGKAELSHAEYNRRIAVKEAEATRHSAVELAKAEVERAKGVAEANKIIGDSLNNNDNYIRYLWVTNLEKGNKLIYVPTEAGLPILEAGRDK